MTSFAEALATIPFSPASTNASGFLPPIYRSMGHLLAAAGRVKDSKSKKIGEFLQEEIKEATMHFAVAVATATDTTPPLISTSLHDTLKKYENLLLALHDEIVGWEADAQIEALRDAVQRGASITALLDREFLGLRSDAGWSL